LREGQGEEAHFRALGREEVRMSSTPLTTRMLLKHAAPVLLLLCPLLAAGCRETEPRAPVQVAAPAKKPLMSNIVSGALTSAIGQLGKEGPEYFWCSLSQLMILGALQGGDISKIDLGESQPDKQTLVAIRSLKKALGRRMIGVLSVATVCSKPEGSFADNTIIGPHTGLASSLSLGAVQADLRTAMKRHRLGRWIDGKLSTQFLFTWQEGCEPGPSSECVTTAFAVVHTAAETGEADALMPLVITLRYRIEAKSFILVRADMSDVRAR